VPSPLFLLLLRTISRFVLAALISTIVVFAAKTKLWEYTRQKVGSIFSINLEYQLSFGRRQITLMVPINKDLRRVLESGETQITAPLPNSATRIIPFPQQEEAYPPSPSSQGSRTAVDPTERQEYPGGPPLNRRQEALLEAGIEGRLDKVHYWRENERLFGREDTPEWVTLPYWQALQEDICDIETSYQQQLFEREPTPKWFTPNYREAYSGASD